MQALSARFDELKEALAEQRDEVRNRLLRDRQDVKEQLDRIETHVQSTNGRVSKLEVWRAANDATTALLAGAQAKDRESRVWLRRSVFTGLLTVAPGTCVGVLVALLT